MPTYVEVISASQGLLPPPCPGCLWWQTTGATTCPSDQPRRLEWMSQVEASWGSVGLVTMDGPQTVASVQFAPVRALSRPLVLPAGAPPEESVLLFCLRARAGRPGHETRLLLHRAMSELRRRHVMEAYAYARPLGSRHLCGVRNLFGQEFLEAEGFQTVSGDGETLLMRVELRGLLPMMAEAAAAVRRLAAHGGHPSPATFSGRRV